MQRPILKRVEYHVDALPIERLMRSDHPSVKRAYTALLSAGVSTIGELIDRRGEVPNMRGIGLGSWNVIVGCMMDFDTAHGTQLQKQFTSAS